MGVIGRRFKAVAGPDESRRAPGIEPESSLGNAPYQGCHAAAAAVPAVGKKAPGVGMGAPASPVDGGHPQSSEPSSRERIEIALPPRPLVLLECSRCARIGGQERGAHFLTDLEVRLPDRGPQPRK